MPSRTSALTTPRSRACRKLKLKTPVARNSQSRGLKAVSPLKMLSDRMKFWLRKNCSGLPKLSALSGRAELAPLPMGIRRASNSVSEMAERFMKTFCP